MPDFNWINAVPVRDWSVPARGWRVLTLGQREFARKSNLQRGDAAAALFDAWAMQQAVSYTHLDVYQRQALDLRPHRGRGPRPALGPRGRSRG